MKRNSKCSVNELEHAATLENMEKSLMQSESLRNKLENESGSLSANYETQKRELSLTAKKNERLKTENHTLRQEIISLSTQYNTLVNELNLMQQKHEDENSFFIGAIIECLQK